jgi:hypothetical protein
MPSRGTSKEWRDYKTINKKNHPIVFYITDTLLGYIQDVLFWPATKYRDVQYYIVNRFVMKDHYLPTRLIPGEYHEIDARMLHGLFETLVDFVEIEKAHMQLWSEEKNYDLYNVPAWYRFRLTRWSKFRCAKAGIDYLTWESTLVYNSEYGVERDDAKYGTFTDQALKAREILRLYYWWKARHLRPDPMEASGWNELFKDKTVSDLFDDLDAEESKERRDPYDKMSEIEEKYYQEDTDKMKELVDIRRGLWS